MTSSTRAERAVKVVVSGERRDRARPLGDVLARPGLRVVRACQDLFEALDVAGQTRADVVVVDAGAGGPGVLRAAEGRLPCPVLVVADREDGDLLFAAVLAGATGFVVWETEAGEEAGSPAFLEQQHRGERDGRASFEGELAAAIVALHKGESVIPSRMLGRLLDDLIRWSHDRDLALREADRLSARQRAVLLLLGSGANMGMIAGALGVSVYTVRSHVHELLRKLGVHSRAEAVLWAARNGVLDQLRRETGLIRLPGLPRARGAAV